MYCLAKPLLPPMRLCNSLQRLSLCISLPSWSGASREHILFPCEHTTPPAKTLLLLRRHHLSREHSASLASCLPSSTGYSKPAKRVAHLLASRCTRCTHMVMRMVPVQSQSRGLSPRCLPSFPRRSHLHLCQSRPRATLRTSAGPFAHTWSTRACALGLLWISTPLPLPSRMCCAQLRTVSADGNNAEWRHMAQEVEQSL